MKSLDVRSGVLYLSRLGRAHAAGELATDDYRRRRREFIETCCDDEPGGREDITVPRSMPVLAADRRDRSSARAAAVTPAALWSRWRWRWVMPFAVALLVMLFLGAAG